MLVNTGQSTNELDPKAVTPVPIDTRVNDEHPLNADSLTSVTELGIVTVFNAEQL